MDYSNFVVLLARQRSGTHALGGILETHPEVFYANEVFQLGNVNRPETAATTFFEFSKIQAQQDPLKLIPVDQEPLFLEYLAYLRQFTTKRYIVLDVKHNSTHHITRNHNPLGGPPYLVDLILKHGLRTLMLKRKNHLRYLVSVTKARATGKFRQRDFDPPAVDGKVRLQIHSLLDELGRCRANDAVVDRWFTDYARYHGYHYDNKFFEYEYADLFCGAGAGPASDFLERISSWLEIVNDFQRESSWKKQSSLPLSETIENYVEVECALRGTSFEHYLQDEPFYSSRSEHLARAWPALLLLQQCLDVFADGVSLAAERAGQFGDAINLFS